MADTPKPESYEQILGELLAAYIAKTGVNDVNVGSLVTSFFEVVALFVARTSGDIFQILRDTSVDRAEGEVLRRIATDEGLRELPARVASGTVRVIDTSFSKISTKIYAGSRAPNVGSATVDVSDASSMPASGSVYIGRGTPNVEGPIAYSAKTQIGGYWRLTLSSPTTKFHNINESVVLSQGGTRNVSVGLVVKAPASGSSPDVNYVVTQAAVILDGETEVSNVQISAQEPGTVANVPIGAIKEFSAPPFSGATVTNDLPFKTGRDTETDEELRLRIKRARLSRGLGTALAVKNSVIGATPADENATVTSSEIVSNSDGTTLYIDDGRGYEEKTAGVGVEFLVESAIGGEQNFQLETGGRQASLAKAFIISNLKGPFDVAGTDRLAITVGGITTEHIFSDDDFVSPGGATAYEISASINSNSDLGFEATTSGGGVYVVLSAKADDNEAIQVADVTTGRNVAELIGLPSNEVQTLRLFKNKQPLSKDGNTASVLSVRQVDWSPSIANGDTLILSVDGTAYITYTVTDADFIAEGTHTFVASTNTLESWVTVLNSKLTGVTASIVGEQIAITSNLGAADRAKVIIDPSSTLVSKNFFSASEGLSSTGKSSDYELSRNTAQIRLKKALVAGDELTAGTRDTEARVQSEPALGGSLSLASAAYIWILADDVDAALINTGVVASTLIQVSKPSANVVRYTSASANAFANVQVGDYVIVWSEELSASNRLEGRVSAVSSATLDLNVTAAEYAAAVAESGILFQEGFVVVRTAKVPQKFKVTSGTKLLGAIADELGAQTKMLTFDVIDDEVLTCSSSTKDVLGSVMIVTFDDSGKNLGFTAGDSDTSKESLLAFYESGYQEGSLPVFVHALFASGSAANPPDSYMPSLTASINFSTLGLDPNLIIGYLQPYGSVLDALSVSETTPLDDHTGTSMSLDNDSLVKRIRINDRFYVANPLDFGHEEEAVVVFDGDAANKTFSVPFYRTAKTNTSLAINPNSFNAYDLEAGATAPFTTFFPSTFKFDNYKVLMQAKRVLDQAAAQDAILFRAVQWGRSGEKINIGYIYPTSPNSPIVHTAVVDKDVNIKLALKSGAAVPTTIDGTTEWDVTITPNTPVAGVDQVTFTWTGTGTAPGLGGLAGGEYVTIAQGSELDVANTGTYRVSTQAGFAPTASSFTIVRKNGEAVAQNDVSTLVGSVFTFFLASSTTASEIVTYVNASTLADLVTASLVNDGGLAGSGVINRSTSEYTNFSASSYFLLDGINWISSTNLSGSPQFSFKRSLALPSATGYAFNQGEEVRLVPTTIAHVSDLANILAVTGLTTLGTASLSDRESRLQIATNLLGGEGSVQVVGGTANSASAPIVGNTSSVENAYALSIVQRASLSGFHSDQWVKLVASNKQEKEALIKDSASIKIDANSPAVDKSTITLFGAQLTDRHFSRPRHHIRSRSRTFKVEKQGSLTCISWDGVGTQPFMSSALNFNPGSGTLNIEKISSSTEALVYILTGPVNFNELLIGNLITISGMDNAENDGTFLVTGISEDGKVLRILNPNAISEFSTATITITSNSNMTGDEFVVDGNSLIAGVQFTVGATAADTAVNLASAISALPGVIASASSNVVTIEAVAPTASVSLVYNDLGGGGGATISGSTLVGRGYTASSFVAISSVSEGDNVILASPFNILNRGKFRVIRHYQNSIYIDNENSVEESVTLNYNPIATNYTGTTQFQVLTTNNRMLLRWTGTGTEPDFSVLRPGDEVTLGTDFALSNRGTFMVMGGQAKKAEVTRLTCLPGNLITTGNYFLINAAANTTLYYVWYNVDGGGGDPAIVGRTGIPVAISSSSSATTVASLTRTAIDAIAAFDATASSNQVTVTTTGSAETTDAVNGNMGLGFEIEITQHGQRTYVELLNVAATAETGIVVTNVLEFHRPQMKFWEYEAALDGDKFLISGNFLGAANQGSWSILEVLNKNTIVVSGSMSSVESTSLLGNAEGLLVEEQDAYVGYKKVRLITIDPASSTRGLIVFDSEEQYNKISDVGAVQIESVNKLNFSTILRKGLDSYRYHTGLIGEANRIVYGDPRDSTTYPGYAAAGAEINIRGALIRRVQASIDVRIETGIPFAQIVEQVRTNVTALVDGNDIGQSIAISDIIETVNTIPGVRAVAISSPLYNAANDVIQIQPREKSKIIDPVVDIAVNQIGG